MIQDFSTRSPHRQAPAADHSVSRLSCRDPTMTGAGQVGGVYGWSRMNSTRRTTGGCVLVRRSSLRSCPPASSSVRSAIGGCPCQSMPFHERWGVLLNENGRIIDPETQRPAALGSTPAAGSNAARPGVIGTNKADALDTVTCMLADLADGRCLDVSCTRSRRRRTHGLMPAQPDYFSYADWERIDALETARGQEQGRPRVSSIPAPRICWRPWGGLWNKLEDPNGCGASSKGSGGLVLLPVLLLAAGWGVGQYKARETFVYTWDYTVRNFATRARWRGCCRSNPAAHSSLRGVTMMGRRLPSQSAPLLSLCPSNRLLNTSSRRSADEGGTDQVGERRGSGIGGLVERGAEEVLRVPGLCASKGDIEPVAQPMSRRGPFQDGETLLEPGGA